MTVTQNVNYFIVGIKLFVPLWKKNETVLSHKVYLRFGSFNIFISAFLLAHFILGLTHI